MRHDNHGNIPRNSLDRLGNLMLGLVIQGAGSLVHYEHAGVAVECTGNA